MNIRQQAKNVGIRAGKYVSFTGASKVKQNAAKRKAIQLFLSGTCQATAIYQGFMFGIRFKTQAPTNYYRPDNELLQHCLNILNEFKPKPVEIEKFYQHEQPKWGA